MPMNCFVTGVLTAAALLATVTPDRAEEVRYFGGYHCTDHCRKHAAGFQWARESRVLNPKDCGGSTRSHVEGCRAYSRDRMRDPTHDDLGHVIDGVPGR